MVLSENGQISQDRLTRRRFAEVFAGVAKPLIAMAHVPALPGAPLYDEVGGLRAVVAHVREEVAVLVDAGFDAVLFCNENDRPYPLHADLAAAATMTRVVVECVPEDVPFGVDYLWDAECALAVAVATGASFMREVVAGSFESDMGAWSVDAGALLRRRRNLCAEDLAIFVNVTPEFASATGRRSATEFARSVVVSSLPDAVLVSGPMAGAQPSVSTLAEVRAAIAPEVPVLLNTGARADNIAEFLQYADGCIVGSSLKLDGSTWNRVDPERAKIFVQAARLA